MYGSTSRAPSLVITTMCPLGIDSTRVTTIITAKVQYIARRAPNRSENHPPTGRSSEAGKMKVAVSSAALPRLTLKLST